MRKKEKEDFFNKQGRNFSEVEEKERVVSEGSVSENCLIKTQSQLN